MTKTEKIELALAIAGGVSVLASMIMRTWFENAMPYKATGDAVIPISISGHLVFVSLPLLVTFYALFVVGFSLFFAAIGLELRERLDRKKQKP